MGLRENVAKIHPLPYATNFFNTVFIDCLCYDTVMISVCVFCVSLVYLFLGLIFMMLTLANVYDVPELNIGYHFYMKSDEEQAQEATGNDERTRLRNGGDKPKYTSTTSQDNAGFQPETTLSEKGDKAQLTSR